MCLENMAHVPRESMVGTQEERTWVLQFPYDFIGEVVLYF